MEVIPHRHLHVHLPSEPLRRLAQRPLKRLRRTFLQEQIPPVVPTVDHAVPSACIVNSQRPRRLPRFSVPRSPCQESRPDVFGSPRPRLQGSSLFPFSRVKQQVRTRCVDPQALNWDNRSLGGPAVAVNLIRSPDGLPSLPPSPAPRLASLANPPRSRRYVPGLSPDAPPPSRRSSNAATSTPAFTRLHCPDCGHEYLLAFSCKQRGLCASCHQRRTLIEAAFIADEICAVVPHRHLVLTLPRLIRPTFKYNRTLLDELYHAAHSAIAAWLRHRTGQPDGQPGLVVAVRSFGDFLFWHPHVHVLAAAGVFNPNGDFHLAPPGGWQELAELWRHTVLRHLRDAGTLSDGQIAKLKNWRQSGFTVDAGEVPLAADDAAGRRRLAEYLPPAPNAVAARGAN